VNVDLRHNPSFAAARIGLEPNEQVRAESGAMMASSYGVSIQAGTQGGVLQRAQALGARRGEPLGGFLVRATGHGTILLACYGALDTIVLAAGESVTIDTGHVVAFGETVSSQIRKVAGGVIQTIKSGEGLVFDFTGPGWVMTQTRNPAALEAWIRRLMPGETGGSGGAVLGGILGR